MYARVLQCSLVQRTRLCTRHVGATRCVALAPSSAPVPWNRRRLYCAHRTRRETQRVAPTLPAAAAQDRVCTTPVPVWRHGGCVAPGGTPTLPGDSITESDATQHVVGAVREPPLQRVRPRAAMFVGRTHAAGHDMWGHRGQPAEGNREGFSSSSRGYGRSGWRVDGPWRTQRQRSPSRLYRVPTGPREGGCLRQALPERAAKWQPV